ncbi:MAG TPA: hypothetical protein VG711_09370 [Phycisphaerales bacterium]|nr:hypothetical protein [Phycisphaerales bacterium]
MNDVRWLYESVDWSDEVRNASVDSECSPIISTCRVCKALAPHNASPLGSKQGQIAQLM